MVARAGPARYAFARGIRAVRSWAASITGCRMLVSVAILRDPDELLRAGSPSGRGEVMSDIVTAGILVIGDEILSGRTKDKKIGFIAEYLTNIGIDLKENHNNTNKKAKNNTTQETKHNHNTNDKTTGGIG